MPEIIFTGPAGRVEGRYHPARQKNAPIAIVLHPHPQFGGTMNHQIIYQLYYAFVHRNFSVLRFNFRGVGKSAGFYAGGIGECDDALAVVAWCRERWPGRPLYLGGFSFGAAVAAQIAARVAPAGLVTVAPPVDGLRSSFVAPRCPWLLVHGEADDVVPAAPVLEWSRALSSPPKVVLNRSPEP